MTPDLYPRSVNWQITYGCQLRCTHCYTESGRRPARRLPPESLLRIAETLAAMKPQSIQIGGGEPLLVPGLFEVAALLRAQGLQVHLYTNGLDVTDEIAEKLVQLFTHVHVSIDGATREVHEMIRGRTGSFDAALRALAALERARNAARARGECDFQYGIDVTLVRSNFAQLPLFCSVIAPAFPGLSFISAGAAVPAGLAGRPSYAEQELLTEEQLATLRDPRLTEELRVLAAASKAGIEQLDINDNFFLQLNPEQVRRGEPATQVMEIEPDGGVRGLLIYEGTVGNILHEPAQVLWQRAQQRLRDPFLVKTLAGVRTLQEWAVAARKIDQHFAAPRDLLRLSRRPEHVASAPQKKIPGGSSDYQRSRDSASQL